MFRLKSHAAAFALVIGLLATFSQTTRAESWSWESILSLFSSKNAAAVCTTNPLVTENNVESGAGTLRQAVIEACPGSTIRFANTVRGLIYLQSGQIVIDKDLIIQGPGAGLLEVQNGRAMGAISRAFYVNIGVTATISGLTITGGNVFGSNGGGGIYSAGNLTVTNSNISFNYVRSVGGVGGGIYSASGTLNVINTTVYSNSAVYGGGIFNNGTLNLTGSSLVNNVAVNFGGGFYNLGSSATIINTTVSGNRTLDGPPGQSPSGAGIYARSGTVTLTNSTIAYNAAHPNGVGGGIYIESIVNSRNSIIAANTGIYPDIRGTLTSQGYNLIGSNAGATIGGSTTGNIVGTNALLAPLANNGGFTQTHALLTGSPAINAGNTATSPATDQRGAPRVGTADIGSFEFNSSPPTRAAIAKAFAPTTITAGGQSVVTLTLSNSNTTGSLTGASFTDTLSNMTAVGGAAGGTCAGASANVLAAGATALSFTGLTIPNNGRCTVIFSVTSRMPGALPNTASGVTTQTTPTGASSNTANLTVIVPVADMTLTKTHTGNFTQGDTGKTYSITVTNSGGTATSGLVSVSDALPGGLAATSINGTGWNCNFSNLTCTRSDALVAGASFPAITLTVNVAGNAPGSVTNFASVSGGGETNTGNNQAADPTTINAAPRYSISGTVIYGTTNVGQPDSFVSGVNLNATGSAISSAVSDTFGNYQLSNLLGGNYTVTPSKTGEIKGINSLDATRIQQHLVGMTTLTANQMIAADTDGSGAVNSLDATRIQQSLIGMQTSNIIGQWKFVPADRQYNALSGNQTGQNYQAILVGEVSGNWATAASFAENLEAKEEEILPTTDNQTTERFTDNVLGQITENVSQSSDSLSTEPLIPAADIQVSLPTNAMRSNGATVTIPITVGAIPAGMSIESFDFSVFYNPAVLQPDATAGSSVGTLSANCSVLPFSPVAGRVIVSGACAQAITTGSGVIYNLTFNVIGAVNQTSGLSFLNVANNTNTFQFNNGSPTVATTNGLFTVLAPTAASVSVSGRVLTSDGSGLRNAIVTMTDQTGASRSFRSSSFGYFHFEDVEAGQTYVFQVNSKRYTFAPQVVTVTDDLTEVNFTAQ